MVPALSHSSQRSLSRYLLARAVHQKHRPTMGEQSKPSDSTTPEIYKFEQENGTFKRQVSSFRSWISSKPGAQFPPEKDRYVSRASPVFAKDISDLTKGPLRQSRMPVGLSSQFSENPERARGNHSDRDIGLGAVSGRMVRRQTDTGDSELKCPGLSLVAMEPIPSILSMASLVFRSCISKQSQTTQHVSLSLYYGTRRPRILCQMNRQR